MWTVETRRRYDREGLRYPTDLTAEEWALSAAHIRVFTRGGRPRSADTGHVAKTILYLLGTDCQWRALKDVPPRSIVFELDL